ncbi:MAG TPA: hypothetical protein VGD98_06415 [Ktedonobacteraceae bacterium]
MAAPEHGHFHKWDKISRDAQSTRAWLDEWVYGVADTAEYIGKLGEETLARIKPGSARAGAIEYGDYR